MKTNELMIGDWVLYKGEPTIVYEIDDYYQRINTEPDGYDSIKCIEISEIESIPLTHDILEKNGWEERPTGHVFYTDGKRYDNSLWYIFGFNTFVVNTAEFQIKYVHELQHILKLLNIDKEIEL